MALPMAIGLIFIALLAGFVIGYMILRRRVTPMMTGKGLEEYSFYPFVKNEADQVVFSPDLFNKAVQFLLENKNQRAAQELIIIGEQNLVRDSFPSEAITAYKQLYQRYDGQSVISDNDQYLENYKRLVQLIGKSFPETGIEILLHNLVNPSRSVVAIENGEVTGRRIENGTTNLVLDLKTRKLQNQDKLNYALQIGARKFKCTTIPIFRRDFGLVGAICINIDANYLQEEVLSSGAKIHRFIDLLLKTDFELDENILSPEEYKKAIEGKKHFMDRVPSPDKVKRPKNRQLLAILFTDIVGFSRIMGASEKHAIDILESNRSMHRQIINSYNGEFLKEMGDGVLASFQSASDAVECAESINKAARNSGSYSLRIGVHLGEVIRSKSDVFGDGVNIACRIQEAAIPGTIFISSEVYHNVRNKLAVEPQDLGLTELKHIEQKVHLYQLGDGNRA